MAEQHETRTTAAPAWTNRTWDQVWERTLGQPERVRLTRAMLRRHVPSDGLAQRVVPELARRWRSQAMTLAIVWGLYAGFWLAVFVGDLQRVTRMIAGGDVAATTSFLPPWMIGLGVFVVACCVGVRAWVAPVARADRPR